MKPIISGLSVLFLALITLPVEAQPVDSLCYWRSADQQVLSLEQLCGNQAAIASPDAAFVANFQKMAGQYTGDTQAALTSYLQTDRDSAIAAAKTACRTLRYGGTTAANTRQQALLAYHADRTVQIRDKITATLAPLYFCPELAGQ